jgi:transposase
MARSHRCLQEEPTCITTQAPDVLPCLLPDATLLRLAACPMDTATAQITLAVCSTHTSVPCPLCDTPARRLHSRYARTLADLPWAE